MARVETLLMTTKQDIRNWLNGSCEADFLIVVCDTFSYDDYPVFWLVGGFLIWLTLHFLTRGKV